MSKSTGDFITLDKVIEDGYAPLDYRFLLLGGHYRSQLTFSWEAMDTAKNARKNLEQRIANLLAEAKALPDFPSDSVTANRAASLLHTEKARNYLSDFVKALEEDISTPRALSVLQQAIKDKELEAAEIITLIRIFDTVLALHLIEEAEALHTESESVDNAEEIERLVAERTAAKKNKDFKRADEIRNLLKDRGIALEDTANGTLWRKM